MSHQSLKLSRQALAKSQKLLIWQWPILPQMESKLKRMVMVLAWRLRSRVFLICNLITLMKRQSMARKPHKRLLLLPLCKNHHSRNQPLQLYKRIPRRQYKSMRAVRKQSDCRQKIVSKLRAGDMLQGKAGGDVLSHSLRLSPHPCISNVSYFADNTIIRKIVQMSLNGIES